mgnify:CR=1 FL=1|jgi:hypothetical protein
MIKVIGLFFLNDLKFLLNDWFVLKPKAILNLLVEIIKDLDKNFAVAINFKLILKPLYKDYSLIGRIIGPIFRFFRVLVGGIIYLLIALVFLLVILVWILILPFIIYQALNL